MLIRALLSTLTLASVGESAHRSSAPDSIAIRLQALADSVIAARPRLPGVLLHVHRVRDGRSWSIAAGLDDTAAKRPLRPEQPLRVASVAKTYVAAAILRLVEQGVLRLDDPIERHLPAGLVTTLRRGGYATDVITIEQVLAHRAGFDEHTAVPSYIGTIRTAPRKRWTREEQVQWLVDSLRPVGPPGAQFKYSDTGYVLLGAIIERYTKTSLGLGVRQLVGYDRLGLRATWWETLEPEPAGVAPRVHQYMRGMDTHDIDPSIDLYGGGGVVAPLSNVATFFTALLTGRVFELPQTVPAMRRVRSEELGGYGLGLFRVETNGRTGFGHSGFWGVSVAYYPADGITIAVAVTEVTQGGAMRDLQSAALRVMTP